MKNYEIVRARKVYKLIVGGISLLLFVSMFLFVYFLTTELRKWFGIDIGNMGIIVLQIAFVVVVIIPLDKIFTEELNKRFPEFK